MPDINLGKVASLLSIAITTKLPVPLIKGETLVFFSEVQQCPDMVTAKLWSCSGSIDYETHRALSNIMDCEEYDLPDVSKG